MRPALYYPWVYLRGGAERTLLELMTRSRHEWTLYTNHFDPAGTFGEFAGLDVRRLPPVSVRRTPLAVARAAATLLTQRLDLGGHEALLVVSEGLGNLVAMRSPIPVSCICLTPLKVAYDDHSRSKLLSRGAMPVHRAGLAAYRLLDRFSWRRYRRVLCNSGEVRRRLLAARLVAPELVEVAHHGVDADRFRPTGERRPFFLVAGRIMWQKNVDLAIESWLAFRPRPDPRLRLVIAGMVDRKSRGYLELLRARAAGRPDIEFVESPADAELIRLYQTCLAVVFPPPNEDWGLVPLEAMACGKPVIATARGGPLESVVHGETGLLVRDEAATFSAAMERLASMPPDRLDEMAAAARRRALLFGWQAFVDRVDAHVEELARIPAALPEPVGAAAE